VATPRFPLDALTPGQRGYALTAGAGNVIERFDVEVLALQYDVGTGFPLVLVRASGPVIAAAGGIASGMSGSPVYLEYRGRDALLGAIGFTFPESTGGLGLVTPIETMRRAKPREGRVAAFGQDFNPEAAVPVRTPLLLSGLSQRASTLLEPLLAPEVVPLPLQTAGGRAGDDERYRLEPGGAISAQLVRGDVTVAAVGTLTLIEDGAFWAFGHRFWVAARSRSRWPPPTSPPLCRVAASPSSSPTAGGASRQRDAGPALRDQRAFGQNPQLIPVTLSLSGDAGALTKRFEVTDDERFYAPLLASAMLGRVRRAAARDGAGTADLAWEIELSRPDGEGARAGHLAGRPRLRRRRTRRRAARALFRETPFKPPP
jgi:hypothetical protein